MNPLLIGCIGFLLGCGSDDVVGPSPTPIAIQANEQSQTTLNLTHDTYVSFQDRHSNFGADTVLRVEKQARVRSLMRIPRPAILQAIGEDSLVSAQLELLVATNGNDWPTQGGLVSLHAMSVEWHETGATWACPNDSDLTNNQADCSPGWSIDGPVACSSGEPGCFEPWRPTATDSIFVTNGLTGEVRFDVTADVAAILEQGYPDNPYIFGWLLRKPQHNESGDISFASRDGVRAPRLFLTTMSQQQVPAVTPDTAPAWLYDRHTSNSSVISGTFLTNIAFIIFETGSTQAERQAAVDAVNGTVVGGKRYFDDDGYYIVLVDDDHPTVPGQALADAIDILNGLPQVASAAPEFLFYDMDIHRQPTDATGWQAGDWELRADAAQGDNWGLERISAPLAWGCSIGDATTSIGVVDRGFQLIPDISANLQSSFGAGVFQGFEYRDHGTLVASVLAAQGDNSLGITGTMWEAGLRLYEGGVDSTGNITRDSLNQPVTYSSEIHRRIEDAARAGVAVINLSQGVPPSALMNPGPQAPSSDHRVVLGLAANFYRTVDRLDKAGLRPLIVVGAGNGDHSGQGIDAYWAGFPIVKDSFPDRILVVAASERSGTGDQLAAFSNRDTLVEIAAPGVDVGTLTGMDVVTDTSGTSVAAPFVSGVAGLLKAFDPGLTSADLKDLIIKGAQRGQRTAGGFPVLNAYESLRAAAERTGAPLCGQRVWADGGSLSLQRVPVGSSEAIASVPDTIGRVEVLHGGKHIRYLTLQGAQSVGWDASTRMWALASAPPDTSGTKRSLFGVSHDGDTLAVVDNSAVATRWYETQGSIQAPVLVGPTGGTLQPVGDLTVNDLAPPLEVTCIESDPSFSNCFLSIVESRAWLFRLGYPQFPDSVVGQNNAYISVASLQVVRADSLGWAQCLHDSNHICREVTFSQEHVETLVYRMDLAGQGGMPVGVQTFPQETVFWIGEGENGEEVVLGRGRWDITIKADPAHFHQTGNPFFGQTENVELCEIEYRERASFVGIGTPIPADNCDFGTFSKASNGAGAGTIAPNVQPRLPSRGGGARFALPIVDLTAPGGQQAVASGRR